MEISRQGRSLSRPSNYSTGDIAPGDLTIVLSSSGPQVDFDNSVNLVDPTNTPEPSSLALLGVGYRTYRSAL